MIDFASLGISVSTKGVKQTNAELNTLHKNSQKSERSLIGLKSILATLITVQTIKKMGDYTDSLKQVENRLGLVTKNSKELQKAMEGVFNVAQTARVGLEGTAELYERMARSVDQAKYSTDDLLAVTETISKSLIISGASAESANAALVQLGQGFAADALRGQELNSVMEQTPRLAKAIADGMGISVGELRKVAEQGQLTSEQVLTALQKQADTINKEFNGIATTIGQAFTQADNQMILTVGTLDEVFGVSDKAIKAIQGFTNLLAGNMNDITDGARTIVAIFQIIDAQVEFVAANMALVLGGAALTVSRAFAVVGRDFYENVAVPIQKGLNSIGLSSDKSLKEVESTLESLTNLANSSQEGLTELEAEYVRTYNNATLSLQDRINAMEELDKWQKANNEKIDVETEKTDKLNTKLLDTLKARRELAMILAEGVDEQLSIQYDIELDSLREMLDKKQITQDEFDKAALKKWEDLEKAKKEISIQQEMQKTQAIAGIAGNLSSILGSIYGENFALAKALGIAEAVINTQIAITKALGDPFATTAAILGGASAVATITSQKFAKGGAFTNDVVTEPTYFGFGNGQLGQMGEAGAEAVMPLSRDASGKLGVSVNGKNQQPQQNINATLVVNVDGIMDSGNFGKILEENIPSLSKNMARAMRR